MANLLSLTCPTCNGTLIETDEVNRLTCEYCNTGYLLEQQRGKITLKPIGDQLQAVQGKLEILELQQEIRRREAKISELTQSAVMASRAEYEEREAFNDMGGIGVAFNIFSRITNRGRKAEQPFLEEADRLRGEIRELEQRIAAVRRGR